MSYSPPSTATAIAAVARLTLVRARRGSLPYVALAIACLPVVAASLLRRHQPAEVTLATSQLTLAILPALLVGPAIGEELEDRTAVYLWSRPIARWAILVGKLVALAPICVALEVGAWVAAGAAADHAILAAQPILGVAIGTLGVVLAMAGLAVVFPRHGMAFAIVYMLVDNTLGGLVAQLRLASLTYGMRTAAGFTDAPATTGVAVLAVIAAIWLGVAIRRSRRLEA